MSQQHSELIATIVGLLIASQFFWEFLKWLIDWIGRTITGKEKVTLTEVSEKLDTQAKDISALKDNVSNMRDEETVKDAQAARRRILRFNDELLRNVDHSKEYFDDILEDIKTYDEYCQANPKFKNGKAAMAEENIVKCYRTCMDKHNFLQ